MEPMQWFFVTTAITLLFVVTAVSPMQAAIDEAVESNAYLQVRKVATIINLVASSPDGTTYTIALPGQKCHLLITESFVKMEMTSLKTVSEIYGLITPNGIQSDSEFDCGRPVTITKANGALTFS